MIGLETRTTQDDTPANASAACKRAGLAPKTASIPISVDRMADQYDKLNPTNLVVTLRSLRRRYDAVAGAVRSDPDLLSRKDEPGPQGDSMSTIMNRAFRAVTLLGTEATRVATTIDPVSPAGAFDPEEWARVDAPPATLQESADSIAATADELADILDRLNSGEWLLTTRITGGGKQSLIEIVRSLVRVAVEELRQAETQLTWLRETQE